MLNAYYLLEFTGAADADVVVIAIRMFTTRSHSSRFPIWQQANAYADVRYVKWEKKTT